MNRQEKQLVVDALKQDFSSSKAAFLIGVQGMSVEQMHMLRKELYKRGSNLKIAKNTLLAKATEHNPIAKQLAPYFKSQIGVVFVPQEFAQVAKVLVDSAKENPNLTLITSCIEADLMDIQVLAALGTKEMQIARLCGVLKGNMARLAVVLNMAAQQQNTQS